MTWLINEVLDGAGMKSHTSLLRTFVCIQLGTTYANFQVSTTSGNMAEKFSDSRKSFWHIFPENSTRNILREPLRHSKCITSNLQVFA